MLSSESDDMSEEIGESEVENLTSDSDDASTDVEEPSDESSENNDDDDDDDNVSSADEDLDEQTQDVLEKKRNKLKKKKLMLENEINNHAVYEGASFMSYQILMNEEEQKVFFQNWTTEKMADTRDIDFVEWQKEHSTREAYFFGPDNVSFKFKFYPFYCRNNQIFIPVHVHKSGHTKKVY